MINKEKFFEKYHIDDKDLTEARMNWQDLEKIHDRYLCLEPRLREISKEFVDSYLYDIEKAGIHSYRYRTKDPGHVLEKIIRKRKEEYQKYRDINQENFYKYLTDLIGIRVLFLYREDWIHFHKYITSVFENDPNQYIYDRLKDFDEDNGHAYIAERPKVYKRAGDSRIYLRCDDYESAQMLDFAVRGFLYLKNCDRIFFCPADVPLFTDNTVRSMLRCAADNNEKIVIPVCEGKKGHPVLIDSSLVEKIAEYSGERGLKGALLPTTIWKPTRG